LAQPSIFDANLMIPFNLSDTSDSQNFIGREDELNEVSTRLQHDGLRHTVILHGLGGVGKTQLAIAYEKQYRNKYSAIFWINSKDEDTFKQSFIKSAQRILEYHPCGYASQICLRR